MKPDGTFNWDLKKIQNAFRITSTGSKPINQENIKNYFTDGRRASFLMELTVDLHVTKGKLAPNQGSGYDVIDNNNKKWEVRSITKQVDFKPSNQTGSGRKFNEAGFLEKLNLIEGYILCDITSFPEVRYWKLKKTIVKDWYENGKLRKDVTVIRSKLFKLLEEV